MRVMVLAKATGDSEEGFKNTAEEQAMMAAMGKFNDDLAEAGMLVFADGLKPSSAGRRVAFDGASRTVSAGPFGPAAELVAGFWLWEVKDIDEAVDWVKRCPNPTPGPSVIEIRPLYEAEDVARGGSAALRDQEMKWASGGQGRSPLHPYTFKTCACKLEIIITRGPNIYHSRFAGVAAAIEKC